MFKYCRSNSKKLGVVSKCICLLSIFLNFQNFFCNQVCRLFIGTGLIWGQLVTCVLCRGWRRYPTLSYYHGNFHGLIEYIGLEGTNRDHQSPAPDPR